MGIQERGGGLAQADPQVWRRRTQDAIKRILLRESLNQPLILVFEDLHWIDAETQAFLNVMVDAMANARILLLVNYRPEYRHEWGNRTCYSQLRLDPLSRESADEMLGVLLGVGAGLEELRRLIAERTEGNPFFIEEIVQALFEQNALVRNGIVKLIRPLAEIKVPPTVQAVLSSRIDRLPPVEKELLQVLGVIGREFRHSLVKRLSGISDNELDRALSNLRSGEFIHEQPALSDTEYAFKHALTQEVAYNSVLLERRKQLHERAGAAIEEMNANRLEDSFEELGHHYSHSNNRAKALRYLQLAAEQAIERSHHSEALAYALRGLELLVAQNDNQECLRAELSLQLVVARVAATTTLSYLPEAEAALSRAYELGQRMGRASETFPVIASLWTRYLLRGDLRKSYELAMQLVEIAEAEGEERFLVVSRFALGDSLYWQGHFREALDNLNQAISKYRPVLGVINLHGWDSVVFSLLYGALCSWHLGYPDKAMPMLVRASERADSINHTETTGMVRLVGCVLHLLRRDSAAAEREAQLMDWLYKDLNATSYDPLIRGLRLCALLQHNPTRPELEELSGLIHLLQQNGASLLLTPLMAILAEGYSRIKDSEATLSSVSNALTLMQETSMNAMLAEFHRIKGESLLNTNDANVVQAEACIRQAIELARPQEGRMLELRATVSLARLLVRQNRHSEASAILGDIYNWFSEGFDTADLKEAKALLEELNG
jgi:tetratricopeptide (TPR) repeat protein